MLDAELERRRQQRNLPICPHRRLGALDAQIARDVRRLDVIDRHVRETLQQFLAGRDVVVLGARRQFVLEAAAGHVLAQQLGYGASVRCALLHINAAFITMQDNQWWPFQKLISASDPRYVSYLDGFSKIDLQW
ncbi:hypothetical protein D3C72_1607720 [compost metagenome]